MGEKHFVYILLTERDTFYCGYTDDVEKRYQAHIEGKGAKYTRGRGPLKIVYQELCGTRSDALKRELEIKALSREKKEALIAGTKD